MKIREFELKHTKGRTSYDCELFLPHVSKETPLKRFRVQKFRELISGLRQIAETQDLQKLCIEDFTSRTELAESLYKAINKVIANDPLYKTKI